MPTALRTCSECPNPLAGKSVRAKTCSDACRLKRSRRIRAANEEVEEFADRNNAGAAEIAAIVRREAPDVVTRVMHGQLEPIVREALTDDVLRAIRDMIGLTEAAVAALTEDLESPDSTVRQRAYTLILKYTVGHPALVKPEANETGPITVHFNLPRPDGDSEDTELDLDVDEAFQVCDMCKEEKPLSEMVAGSTRCLPCFAEAKAKVLAEFA